MFYNGCTSKKMVFVWTILLSYIREKKRAYLSKKFYTFYPINAKKRVHAFDVTGNFPIIFYKYISVLCLCILHLCARKYSTTLFYRNISVLCFCILHGCNRKYSTILFLNTSVLCLFEECNSSTING